MRRREIFEHAAETIQDADHARACGDDALEIVPFADNREGLIARLHQREATHAGKVLSQVPVCVDEFLFTARLHAKAHGVESSHRMPTSG